MEPAGAGRPQDTSSTYLTLVCKARARVAGSGPPLGQPPGSHPHGKHAFQWRKYVKKTLSREIRPVTVTLRLPKKPAYDHDEMRKVRECEAAQKPPACLPACLVACLRSNSNGSRLKCSLGFDHRLMGLINFGWSKPNQTTISSMRIAKSR